MKAHLLSLIAALFVPGCLSPNVDPEVEGSDATDGSSSGTDAGTPSSGGTTDDPTATTNPSTTDEPATTNPSTTDTTTDDLTTDESGTGGPAPFCGDGNLDPGEDCDDGDDNGADQACLPDCNVNGCGDGNLAPDEACDDGEGNNVLEVGACAPDCSRVIEERVIRLGATFSGGDFQPNPVGLADSLCEVGDRALFTVPGVRQATAGTPNQADAQQDWPLRPFTAYVRADGTPIWTTDATPLLGVRDGVQTPLVNPIVEPCMEEFCLYTTVVATGMEQDWTPGLAGTCNGWSSGSEDLEFIAGEETSVDEFLASETRPCSVAPPPPGVFGGVVPRFYCVEL